MLIDGKDKKILDVLLEDARLTTAQISKKTDIPITTVHNRIRSMRQSGIIKKFTVEPDYKKLGLGITAYVLSRVDYRDSDRQVIHQEELARKIRAFPEVYSLSILAGPEDLLMQVRVKDVDALNDFVTKKLRELPGVDSTQTMLVLNEVSKNFN